MKIIIFFFFWNLSPSLYFEFNFESRTKEIEFNNSNLKNLGLEEVWVRKKNNFTNIVLNFSFLFFRYSSKFGTFGTVKLNWNKSENKKNYDYVFSPLIYSIKILPNKILAEFKLIRERETFFFVRFDSTEAKTKSDKRKWEFQWERNRIKSSGIEVDRSMTWIDPKKKNEQQQINQKTKN